MTLPKISIVTPSLNQGVFLEDAIQSVLSQDYPNLEYVIADGGSTDNSVEIIKKYQSRLHYWVSEQDRGHGHALNKGFSHTTGEIMAWLNGDDKYTPWSFRTVAEIFTQFPNIAWISGISSNWNKNGAMINVGKPKKNIYDFLAGDFIWIQQESTFWRRSLWDKAGGYINENYAFMVDGELWTRFFLHEELYSVDCVLGGYRVHAGNRAKLNYQKCLDEMDRAIQVMRHQCSEDTLKKASRLVWLGSLTKMRFLNHAPIRYLIKRLLGEAVLRIKGYPNITWQNDQWTERRLPYLKY